jgi:hypothetical protein
MEENRDMEKKQEENTEIFELLKIITEGEVEDVKKDPRCIGEYFEEYMLSNIDPGLADEKCNGMYIAKVGCHLEIGYVKYELFA